MIQQVTLMAVLMVMVYSISLDLRPDDFRYVARHPLAVGIGLLAQFGSDLGMVAVAGLWGVWHIVSGGALAMLWRRV